MSSTQRSTQALAGTVGAAAAITASDPWLVPVGASVGGVQITTALASGGAFNGGSVGGTLQGTIEGTASAPGSNWVTVPGGVLAPAASATSSALGDGNNQIDVSAFLWLRLLPTVDTGGGTPANVNVTANLKFDYNRG